MKLSDYVVDFLAKQGIKHNFLVTGGAVLHLADSTSKHPSMKHICVQHEEFGAAAADGYSRAGGNLGLAMTTSGPGATNLLTSICNAHFDSIPMICITGQVARFRLRPNKKLRQRGFQETDISSVFESVTKYVKLVTDPSMIRYELEKAIFIAKEGRPGPVVLDIPDDLQREEVEPNRLHPYTPEPTLPKINGLLVEKLFTMISDAKRPVLIVGAGVHCAKVEKEIIKFAEYFNLPILLTWGATDLIPYEHPLNMGGVGVCGPRAGNFAAQSSDLVIAIGTRLSQMITGGKQNLFAPLAKKVMIDIDPEELNKFKEDTFLLDLPILANLKDFFLHCDLLYKASCVDHFLSWREKIQDWKKRYPICSQQDYEKKGRLNPYVFVKELSKISRENDIIVTDTGANICWMMQAFETKPGQKIFSAWNHTPMGYSLPASIGAALSTGKEITCLIGDGGLMMCLQELATVKRYNLPIKIFIFENKGHATVKQTIEIWLKANYVAVDEDSGLSFPDYQKLAETFHLPFYSLQNHDQLQKELPLLFKKKGPFICHLAVDETHRIVPMLKFGKGLEDLDPKLPGEELESVMNEYKNLTPSLL
ncbi:MAG: acetolactate synthase [Chlamydiae bacterium CG10_big_fil_rev_8_21_14_0_10_35_9]|nr:MAG: acetolactate synthase [Chlamydiae bacterium CG10_big_fil_rev_8_21_14_0_10_35_9]